MKRHWYLLILTLALTITISATLWLRPHTITLTSAQLPNTLRVSHRKSGQFGEKLELQKGSIDYTQFCQWLDAHRNGWKLIIDDFAPNVEVRAELFAFNFLTDAVVLNIRQSTDAGATQYILEHAGPFPDFVRRR